MQVVAITDLHQAAIGLHTLKLLFQGDHLLVLQCGPKHQGELLYITLRPLGIGSDERLQGVQGVEHEMGIHLTLQGLVVGDDVFCPQGFVFHRNVVSFVQGMQQLGDQQDHHHEREVAHQSVSDETRHDIGTEIAWLDQFRHQGERQTQHRGDQHRTENQEEHPHPLFLEIHAEDPTVIKEQQEDQHEVAGGEQQDSPDMEMSLRILLDLREEKGVPKEGGDGEEDMEAHADAQGEQQDRLQRQKLRFVFSLDHDAKLNKPEFLS